MEFFFALEGVDVFRLIQNLSDVEEGGMFSLLKLYMTEDYYRYIVIHILLFKVVLQNISQKLEMLHLLTHEIPETLRFNNY